VVRRAALIAALAAIACAGAPAAAQAVTPPTITYTLSGTAGDNGWHRSAVTVSWAVNFNGQAVSSTGCEPAIRLTRETSGTTLSCRADNEVGSTTVHTGLIRIDLTPPAVTGAAAARPPDANDWYRSPVAVRWSGSDALSGIADCTSLTYGGPDGPASLPGSCRDKAGNVSATTPFALRYDVTRPGLSAVTAAGGDTVATVRWRAAADAVGATVARSPGVRGEASSIVYSGPSAPAGRFEDSGLRNRTRYTYTVSAVDAAGNATSASTVARTVSRLRGPRPGARVTRPPVLRWKRVRGARYYNVQLYQGTRKVLSAWPSRPRLRLHRRWRYAGRRFRLAPATYQWYVWPGYGRRAQRRYGLLLGTRRFAVIRRVAQ
jgi:hypothetical protein